MNNKTAVQELINELKQFKKIPMVDSATIDAAIEFAGLKIEKEKQHLLDAYKQGNKDMADGKEIWAIDYYNETFK